ncbi:MAG: hypothetical protein GWP10_14820 [Nitrospiraceae bacterium]|nr:hypothetical protein [Nitrospiraceae bacterium]
MKSWIRNGCAGLCIGAFILMGAAHASGASTQTEIKQLKKLIEQQTQTINQLKGRLTQIEMKQKDVEVEVTNQKKAMSSTPKIPEWVSKIKLHGDFRYRHEYIDEDGKDSRTRHRIRTRIGMAAKVNDAADFHFRLASGSKDPVSTNQTLTGGYTSKSIWIDRAYVDWHPTFANTCGNKGHLMLGKIKNPFLAVHASDLIWDHDLNPEGAAITYQTKLGNINPFITLGGFWIAERKSSSDSGMFGGQIGIKPVFGKIKVLVGGGYFGYVNTQGEASFVKENHGFGNTLDAHGNYVYGYKLLEAFAQVGTTFKKIPVKAFGDYVYNSDPSTDNKGWLVGFQVGKCKKPYSWEFKYNYRRLEKDATVGAFSDSDFVGGGTDGKGHKLSAGFQLARNWKLGATYFICDKHIDDSHNYNRLQVDLKFKF